ncbi:unnamed protein product [Strongylus vulgaris]|uniref:Uncharacterized protein n=1 Tax=Strongylus vulgaris TaxID=40348 RepID=A0A3P7J9P0_STRVU|nr:unnamed protein product [Strongylus vulgaris]
MTSCAGLSKVAVLIEECFDAVAGGTLKIYKRVSGWTLRGGEQTKRRKWLHALVLASTEKLPGIRRKVQCPFCGPTQAQERFRGAPYRQRKNQIARIPYQLCPISFHPLLQDDQDILKALLRSAKKNPVKYRGKATQYDVDMVIDWALNRKTLSAIAGASAVLLLFVAFLRISELCALRVGDVSYKEDNIWWLTYENRRQIEGVGAVIAFRLSGQALILWRVFENFFLQIRVVSFLAAGFGHHLQEMRSREGSRGLWTTRASPTDASPHIPSEEAQRPRPFALEPTLPTSCAQADGNRLILFFAILIPARCNYEICFFFAVMCLFLVDVSFLW